MNMDEMILCYGGAWAYLVGSQSKSQDCASVNVEDEREDGLSFIAMKVGGCDFTVVERCGSGR